MAEIEKRGCGNPYNMPPSQLEDFNKVEALYFQFIYIVQLYKKKKDFKNLVDILCCQAIALCQRLSKEQLLNLTGTN